MKLPYFLIFLALFISFPFSTQAQKRRPASAARNAASVPTEAGQKAVVIDETLSVLRAKPSLYADPIQRMRRGRKIQIQSVVEADGVKFFKVSAPPASTGWVQADAVFGKFRPNDERRLAALVQASTGFEQIEVAALFFELYPESPLRPAIQLLYGDLLEETAARLSRDVLSRLSRKEMAASGAPLHSYYLNFVSLDRYRKLGINFLFNASTRQYHYDGASWKELIAKSPLSAESAEARKRLDTLKTKLDASATSAN